MSESETAPTAPAAGEAAAPGRGPGPWAARCALVAAAGLVVGGVAYGAVEVASALSPTAPAASSEPAGSGREESEDSERRTVSLLPDPHEAADEEEARADSGSDGAGAAAGSGGGGAADGNGSGASGGAPGGTGGATGTGEDPRREILDEILNSPQPRPPLEPLVDQEDVDAEREAAEAGVEPAEVEFDPEDYSEFYGGHYDD